jgi:hypothetical protein
MAAVHMLIGAGEALITAFALVAIARTRPELLADRAMPTEPSATTRFSPSAMAIYGLLICIGLALFVSPLASKWPDGLETVATRLGLTHMDSPPAAAPAQAEPPTSTFPSLLTAAAGAAGVLSVFILSLLLARILVPKAPPLPQSADAAAPTPP